MRAVCFVNRLEIDLSGNVFSNALAFGDVDNDGQNEFIVGDTSGELVVFKGGNIWQQLSGLGMITAVSVGDVLNLGFNALIAVSGDGWCHILSKTTIECEDGSKEDTLECVHVQRIPANTKDEKYR
uniref:Uncharacterized protein n=1 Tax=Timema bartmani TaxID=61472 RepID=A0A7R9HWD3_9NEOP|nr:unnamed protein product [Timema bartmani]